MTSQNNEMLNLYSSEDIVRARQKVRAWTAELGFSLVDQTKMVTAASELARNTLEHGGGGNPAPGATRSGRAHRFVPNLRASASPPRKLTRSTA